MICYTEPSKSVANGKKCYHCNGQTCTGTLLCQGSEDYCISKSGEVQLIY